MGGLVGSYSTALGKAMVAFATAHGFSSDEILALMQITEGALDDPDGRLPVGPAFAFWEHLVRKLDDPAVPIRFAAALSATDFGVLGFAAVTAPSAAAGLRRAARYYELLADTARLVLHESSEGTRIELVRAGERDLGLRIMNENTIACMMQVVRSVTRMNAMPVEVAFRHPAPADVSAHRRFFGERVRFSAPYDGLVLAPSILESVPPMRDANMESFFARHAADLFGRLRIAETLTERVRAAIAHDLADGEPQIAGVAKRLGLSDRSLRRHLKEENVTFRVLADDVRRTLAVDYLERGHANLTEVAYLLGFSESSAFTRAFKRWYGRPPRAYRRA